MTVVTKSGKVLIVFGWACIGRFIVAAKGMLPRGSVPALKNENLNRVAGPA